MEAKMLLRNPDVFPSEEILAEALGQDIYGVLESFLETVTGDGLTPEWRFYNDGKAWLCKVTCKKKTVLWLSIWEGYFKTSFFFTEKYKDAIDALDISETIKREFSQAKPSGKLIPMIFDVRDSGQLEDLLAVVGFKKSSL